MGLWWRDVFVRQLWRYAYCQSTNGLRLGYTFYCFWSYVFFGFFWAFLPFCASPAIVNRMHMASLWFNLLILGTPLVNTFATFIWATITYTHHALIANFNRTFIGFLETILCYHLYYYSLRNMWLPLAISDGIWFRFLSLLGYMDFTSLGTLFIAVCFTLY